MTKEQFYALVGVIKSIWTKFELDEEGLAAWFNLLGDLDFESAGRAVRQLGAESSWAPQAPADIRRIATNPGTDDFDAAWSEVKRNISHPGRNGSPSWSSEGIKHTVNALGWEAICNTNDDDVSTLRAQFRDMLSSYNRRAHHAANVGRLEAHRSQERISSSVAGEIDSHKSLELKKSEAVKEIVSRTVESVTEDTTPFDDDISAEERREMWSGWMAKRYGTGR